MSSKVSGRTIRFTWSDGPTQGKTHEHVFHSDGTVQWAGSEDRPKYADEEVTPNVRLVSYLASSGFTLTSVLNFENETIVGVASNDTSWFPIHGTFEVMS